MIGQAPLKNVEKTPRCRSAFFEAGMSGVRPGYFCLLQ
ncbi:hypothetical protein BOO71_0011917 [Deinococcus marmoris]|uniref:Uncharacterized protein n=1 Tax=Deinococcus marmoris TaxID=249408 RepID=A0A1U7NU31_9DEIO|nr:hypothetical protein BOO71_0011917 [Deinococcus marmoris]